MLVVAQQIAGVLDVFDGTQSCCVLGGGKEWWVAAIGLKLGSRADLADSAFLIGLCLLILGVSAMIMKTGFLSPIVEGFKIIGERMIRRSRSMERADDLIQKDHDFQAFKSNLSTRITQGT